MMFSPTSYMKYAYLMLFLSVNNDKNAEASCPAESSPVVRMCQNGEVKNTRIYVDASSARNVSATECRCTILLHDGGQVVWTPLIVPGYDTCDTSLQVDNTQQRLTIGCLGGSLTMDTLPLRSTINLTLHKPIELNNPNAADYCYKVSEKPSNLTIKCCDPSDQICVINSGETDPTVTTTTENIPEELPTTSDTKINSPGNFTTHKSSTNTTDSTTQLGGQEDTFPVNIVAPAAAVGAIVLCIVIIVAAVCIRKRRQKSKNTSDSRQQDGVICDNNVYDEISEMRESKENKVTTKSGITPVTHYSTSDTGDVYAEVNKGSTLSSSSSKPQNQAIYVNSPTNPKHSVSNTQKPMSVDDDQTYAVVDKSKNSKKSSITEENSQTAAKINQQGTMYADLQSNETLDDNKNVPRETTVDTDEKTIYSQVLTEL